jgi:diguanylate cyclase (GGDEF)-like protein
MANAATSCRGPLKIAQQVMTMRDMTMVTNAQTASGINAVNLSPLTPEQELITRFKLLQALQITLEPRELIATFFKHIQTLVTVSGLGFTFSETAETLKLGRVGVHHSDYKLTTDDGYLGEIIFSRSKRFKEDELIVIESLLGILVYPLRNALRYQDTLRLALLDPLTRIGNRTALNTALRRELQLAERHHHELSLLMIDVDHFKNINDLHGHKRGDQVLCEIAKKIQQVCRDSDITFRYGGEEFVVILGKTSSAGARIIAERIRQRIADCKINFQGCIISPTVSVGIATRTSGQKELVDDLFERADKALYAAKAAGRNRVITSETSITS